MKKLLIFQLILVVVLISAVLFIARQIYEAAGKKILNEFNLQQLLLAQRTSSEIEIFLNDVKEELIVLSNSPKFSPDIASDFLYNAKLIYRRTHKKIATIFFEDEKGILKYIYPEKLHGVTGKDFSFRDYFRKCKDSLQPQISDFLIAGGEKHTDVTKKYPALVVTVPFVDKESGEFKGVIGADVYLTTLFKNFINPIRLEGKNTAWVVDNKRNFLAHSNPSLIGKNLLKLKENLALREFFGEMRGKKKGVILFYPETDNITGKEILKTASFCKIKVGEKKWVICVSAIPLDKKIVSPIYVQTSILTILTILVMVISSFVLYRTVSQVQKIKLEALEKELEIAYKIQVQALPKKIPEIPGYEIFAMSLPAKDVGGDFYDFFSFEENTGLVIADVSDKGIPAALFMMMSKTLLWSEAKNQISPEIALEKLNYQLEETSDSDMFITAFYGILNPETHLFTYARAGHNYPIVFRKEKEKFEFLKGNGRAIGISSKIETEKKEIFLNPGDLLLLYTDGLVEPYNKQSEPFGLNRVEEIIKLNINSSVKKITGKLVGAVKIFTQNVLFDDITLVCLKRKNVETKKILEVETSPKNLEVVKNFVQKYGENKLSSEKINQLILAVEEIFINITSYANFKNTGQKIKIAVESAENSIKVSFSDRGTPFNPLKFPPPDLKTGIDKRELGGVGIYLAKKMTDKISYERKGDTNCLVMEKNI